MVVISQGGFVITNLLSFRPVNQGTLFCHACLILDLAVGPWSCRCYSQSYTELSIDASEFMEELIGALRCRCSCGFELQVGGLDAHKQYGCAPHVEQRCGLGCGWVGPGGDLASHQIACSHLSTPCATCGQVLLQQDMDEHTATGCAGPPEGGIPSADTVSRS